MTKIEEAKKKVQKLLDGIRKEYSGLSQEIDAYKGKAEAAADEMQKASDACDITAYNAAKEKKEAAETALNMYQARAEKLEEDPLMDQAEYEKLCNGIVEEVSEYFDKLQEDLFDITKEMEGKADEARQTINEANSVLHLLQYDVNRGMDLEYNITNNRAFVRDNSVKQIKDKSYWDIIGWAGKPTSSGTYQTMKKDREEAE